MGGGGGTLWRRGSGLPGAWEGIGRGGARSGGTGREEEEEGRGGQERDRSWWDGEERRR